MSDELKRLSKYQNVTLYPNSFPILVEKNSKEFRYLFGFEFRSKASICL